MDKIKCLKCINCSKEHNLKKGLYVCEECGSNLEIIYNYDFIKSNLSKDSLSSNKDYSVWRYEPALPIKNLDNIPNLQIGWTPLYKSKRLAEKFSLKKVYLKDDGRNPSASYKDRASSVAVVNALENNEKIICGASTGNAASSMACLTASLDVKTIIFVPETAPKAKIAQLLIFGSTVIMVKGTYDDAFDLSIKATEEYGWYNRNTGFNPFTREGKKTSAFEICEQLNWEVPDIVFVPVGDGNIISGVWKGFKDLYALGFISRLPKLAAVQAEFSNAVYRAFNSDGKIEKVSGKTVADSISVSLPRDGEAAVKAVRESNGFAVEVTDNQILDSIKEVAIETSIFGEPAGVTSYAGLKKCAFQGKLNKDETIVLLITGSGLKDVDSAMKTAGEPFLIEPDIEALKKIKEHI